MSDTRKMKYSEEDTTKKCNLEKRHTKIIYVNTERSKNRCIIKYDTLKITDIHTRNFFLF